MMRPRNLFHRVGALSWNALAMSTRYLVWYYLMSVVLLVSPLPAQAPWTGPGVGLPAQAPPTDREQGLPAAAAVPVVGLTVSDMDRSLEFYTRVLPFTVESDAEVAGTSWEQLTSVFGVRLRIVRLRLGDERLELSEYLAASTPGRPAPVDSRSNDRWFQHVAIIVSDMDSAYHWLRAHRARSASTGPQLLPKSIPGAAGIRAFYFKDPDGHPLEILQFPPDKGDPKWHRKAKSGLFLGIDHTAIVVGDTERSLAFYRDLLGLRVAGESQNFGTEQEHLNNVEGARLRITGLRSPAGPGIELLEYLAPTDGRGYPADERPNDLVHWQTTVQVRGLAELFARLDSAAVPVISRSASSASSASSARRLSGNHDSAGGVLVRDPDGHVLQLVDR
jgi:catechol 2,3-dioxygenase-like lactoylglutathione lyase family enzyme